MQEAPSIKLVTTISERCRACYTCVRECPAKAIRIADGQAEVLAKRCIGCGNCVRVCSQHAKRVLDATLPVRELLAGPVKVVAIVAPSFPAEFAGIDHHVAAGMLRQLGFSFVYEVGFGADVVADRYRLLLINAPERRSIATSCPAVVGYVERFQPGLIRSLAPIVSPMIAMARVVRQVHEQPVKVVFIGPCIAKKDEARAASVAEDVDEVLTFAELREMFDNDGIRPEGAVPSDFDPPHAGAGALFPIGRGLLQAAGLHEDLMDGSIVATDGRTNFVEALREFENGDLDAKLLEVLCCNGCIMGAGLTCEAPLFGRRSRVATHVRKRWSVADKDEWKRWIEQFSELDLTRTYEASDQRIPMPTAEELTVILARLGKCQPEDELNCGACGYDTCREHAVAIHKGMAEVEMCLPYTIEQLRSTVAKLAESHRELAKSHQKLDDAQDALRHSERLASMGQLAAGVAHEVNNPLGIVLMYAHMLLEEKAKYPDLGEDFQMIVEQTDRCKKIVARLLDFARQNKVIHQAAHMPDLVERCIKTVVTDKGMIAVHIEHNAADPVAEVDTDQMTQVLTNLVNNAIAAMPDGGELTVSTSDTETTFVLEVTDTGVGIPEENLTKIFEPFFTTKQIGKGTGLGLSVTYGIVKMHRGNIQVRSNADPSRGATGSTFTVEIPRRAPKEE